MKYSKLLLLASLSFGCGCVVLAESRRGELPNESHRKVQSDSSEEDLCASIIAIAFTRDPSTLGDRTLQVASKQAKTASRAPTNSPTPPASIDESVESPELDEEFVCERAKTGELLALLGNEEQMAQLRDSLYNGELVSAETTIAGLTEEDLASTEMSGDGDENSLSITDDSESNVTSSMERVVKLPPGQLKLKPGNGQQSQRRRLVADRIGDKSTRKLAVYEGLKKVLVVRVSDMDGLVHPDNAKTMSDKIFGTYGDTTTLTSQMRACSFGKLNITNTYGFSLGDAQARDAPGVVEVSINISLKTSSKNEIQKAAKLAVETKIGQSLPGPFDHVMFSLEGCYVQGDCGWAAYGQVNSWLTVYKGNNYKFPAVQMHEIGHNLNLAHSGSTDGKVYTDHTCLMGNPWFNDDISQMCFNAAKSFQIAEAGSWYDGRVTTWDSGSSNPKRSVYKIIGIADYNNNPAAYPVVVKLETGSIEDIFVGFNRAAGINSASKIAKNQVTVVRQGQNGVGYSTSVVQAFLSSGGSFRINNWHESQNDMVITVNKIQASSSPWYAEVEFNFNNAQDPLPPSSPPPSPRPSPQPTRKPTPKPTQSPTKTCGDSVCSPNETDVTCPVDCVNAEFVTYTDNTGAKGSNGTMFKIQALRDLSITSISSYVMGNQSGLVQVYSRQGTYKSFEGSDDGWELLFDQTIFLNGKGDLTNFKFTKRANIKSDQYQSFYIYTTSNLLYREESVQEEDFVKGDKSLRFFSGIAIAYGKFGGGQVFTPRVFSGVLRYDGTTIESSTLSPSRKPSKMPSIRPTGFPSKAQTPKPTVRCGDGICDSNEHVNNCAVDCSDVKLPASDAGDRGSEGTMFHVKALRDVAVTSFDIYGVSTAESLFQVYTRDGLYEGYQRSQDAWTLIYDNTSLQQKGRYTLVSLGSFPNAVVVPAGAIQSFYLYTPTKLMYEEGNPGVTPFSKNDAVEFYGGIGVQGFFNESVSPRVLSGIMRYDVLPPEITRTPKPTTSKPITLPTLRPINWPVDICNNSICESSENSMTCPSDCKEIILSADKLGLKGAEGTMFSIRAVRDVSVQSFGFFGNRKAKNLVQVYTRPGGYRGFEGSQNGWNLVYNNNSVDILGRTNSTFLGGFVTPANGIQSFLIYSPLYVLYNDGTQEGAVYSSDGMLEFHQGIGVQGFFSGNPPNISSPRVFRGTITYDVIRSTCTNDICETHETSATCPTDCRNLTFKTTDVAAKGTTVAMFYLRALRDIKITSLDFFGGGVGTNEVTVHTRTGKYTRHPPNSDGWEIVYDNDAVNIMGKSTPTPIGSFTRGVVVESGAFQSFYIYSPMKVMYQGGTTNTSEGSLYSSNESIEFFEGAGVEGLFSGNPLTVHSPRIWRGVIRYDVI